MTPIIWTIIITSLSTSTIITTLSHHWLLAWLGLELNTLSMLPLIMSPANPRATEAATKYFIIQTVGATLILFASTTNAWHTGQWTIMHTQHPFTSLTLTLALALKLGAAPMHAWYPEVLQGSTITMALVISTWQKVAPLALLYMLINHLPNTLVLLLGLTSALLGGWAGLNQTQTRKLMAFSSIAHLGWLLTALTLSPTLTTMTFITYTMMTTVAFMLLNTTATKTLTNTTTMWSNTPVLMVMMLLSMMTLSGLPPLMGFAPKWFILQMLTTTHLTPLAVTLALASLPGLFFYTRLTYLSTLTTPPNTTNTTYKWRLNTSKPLTLATLITMTTMLLPMTPLLTTT
uniref:NADH-ubiquinone oxidoreductase chain 2 n=1 Tax=Ancylodactylus dickersonae TaxID=3147776 RepID=J7GB42_9SAUR|nr:NADH dehydrogenase subunit 2 [Cnemaspis dickersonae]